VFRLNCLIVAVAAVVVGCASGDETLDTVDPAAVAANPTYDQVFAIVHRECLMCHDTGGDDDDNNSGPYATLQVENDVDLSTCTAIVAQRESILEEVDANTMPPGAMPRLSSEEKLLIRRWIDNGAPAPCN
jgi:uncharacterized membrane protein